MREGTKGKVKNIDWRCYSNSNKKFGGRTLNSPKYAILSYAILTVRYFVHTLSTVRYFQDEEYSFSPVLSVRYCVIKPVKIDEMQEVVDVLEALRATAALPPSASPIFITLQPRDFFVAFGGVLCVVFEGFPRCIEQLKADLDTKAPSMIRENLGSKWAKTTIGALGMPADGISVMVRPETWLELHDVCLAFRAQLRATQVRVACLVAARLHDRLLSAGEVVCALPSEAAVAGCCLSATPLTAGLSSAMGLSDAMRAKTMSVMCELEDNPRGYFMSSLAKGLTFFEHYASAADGDTLVLPLHRGFLGGRTKVNGAPIGATDNTAFFEVLQAFQKAAVGVMPGLQWSPLTALHCTVRGIR